MNAPRVLVDVGDPQALTAGIGVCETTGEKFSRCGEALELQREFGALMTHAAAIKRPLAAGPLQPWSRTISDSIGWWATPLLVFRRWPIPSPCARTARVLIRR